ncbi:uncharacterized protein PRCAT00003192001 [Priceomyces carsonii]|uniref:uncharacterized protein n=1 Tax=Priceomyces carsonii TaxID=28549 RepID=UPI002EDA29D5|nr:unnamed protein product [Priceomyces carsonii]
MSTYQSTSQNEVEGDADAEHEADHSVSPSHARVSSNTEASSSDLEREPLIERQPQFLDPDDPKVSPLNLKYVKVLRFVLVSLVIFNTFIFFGILLSDFIAIPGFNNRGRSFLEMDLMLLNIFSCLITLWCFVVPAYYERLLGYVSSTLIAIDIIVVLSVPYIRGQFGFFGFFILLWTLLNNLFNCYIDFKIESGRRYQEIRFTGRVEKRRSVSELLVMFLKIIAKVFLLWVIWDISLSIWLQSFDSHEKPWGKMVSVQDNELKVHLSCYGDLSYNASSQPIVLLEGGQLTSSEEFQEWVEELYQLNKLDRYCIWDRPGYGFSDSAPSPVSISLITEHLAEALRKEKIEGPYSLVGFDIGGLYSRMFASRNPGRIHSILLVDSWHEDLLRKRPFAGHKNEGKNVFKNILELMDTATGFKLWLKGLVSPLGITTSIHWFFHPKRYSSNSRIFGRDMYHLSKYIRARLQEQITSSILSYNELKGADISNVPLGVISSDYVIKRSSNWGKWQRSLTKLSSKAFEWVIAKESQHLIWKSPRGREQLQDLLLRLISGDS